MSWRIEMIRVIWHSVRFVIIYLEPNRLNQHSVSTHLMIITPTAFRTFYSFAVVGQFETYRQTFF